MLDVVLDSVIDCLKLIPFLFITYLLMEWLEHKTTEKTKNAISKADRFGPIIGGILGIVPQCGFSVSATNLYVGRIISLGTLIAIYLSTSDEMLPIFISEAVEWSVIAKILAIKCVCGIIAGLIIDFVYRKSHKDEHMHIEEICENEKCDCSHGFFKSTLKHTINISIFILVVNLILNTLLALVGEDNLSNLLSDQKILGPILSGIIGLIPNCAASVIIAELFIKQVISFGTMMAGLLVGAGVGLLVLFRVNKHLKDSFKIVGLLYAIGVIVGIIFELIGITV